jgi:hypothetical protein
MAKTHTSFLCLIIVTYLFSCGYGVLAFGWVFGTAFALSNVETIDYKYAIKRKGAKYGYEQDNRNRFGNDKLGGCRNGGQYPEGPD